MIEQRESEFAYIVGQLMGFLSSPDVQEYLLEHKVNPMDIKVLSLTLKDLAGKVFYGDRR